MTKENEKDLSEFKKLKFSKGKGMIPSRARLFFDNGYGISVIKGGGSYTKKGQYEIAVLIGNKELRELCYTTTITDDVVGYLSPEQVETYIVEIKNYIKSD